jgi:predicted TPR repeat methyltransferase
MQTSRRYKIRFPSSDTKHLSQSQAFFLLEEPQGTRKIRFHDYSELYAKPGLYEQLFYDRLKCESPAKVSSLLHGVVTGLGGNVSQLRVLDVGAGNGMMGEALSRHGVARLVGIDISQAACDATQRDRPGVYDAYYVTDLTRLTSRQREELLGWRLDCMTTVAALGFDDIPPKAFLEAFNLIETGGWIAFNIKETFLDNRDTSGFSIFIKQLILSDYIDLHHLERYRHRISIDGDPLYYFAVVARKNQDVGPDFLASLPQ